MNTTHAIRANNYGHGELLDAGLELQNIILIGYPEKCG